MHINIGQIVYGVLHAQTIIPLTGMKMDPVGSGPQELCVTQSFARLLGPETKMELVLLQSKCDRWAEVM